MPKKRGAKRSSAKNVLRLPDLDDSKTSVFKALDRSRRNVPMPTPSTTSSPGTAPNPDWR